MLPEAARPAGTASAQQAGGDGEAAGQQGRAKAAGGQVGGRGLLLVVGQGALVLREHRRVGSRGSSCAPARA